MFNFLRLSVSGTALILACATVCFAANPNSPFYTTRVGDYNLTIVSDGAGPLLPLDGFVAGVHEAAFKQVLNSRFLSGIQNLDMNVPFLDMGDKKLLFDAGSGGVLGPAFGKLVDNMRKAGLDPEEVDTVVITHAHPDHIGGILAPDGSLAFPNANYMIPRVEYEFWRDVSFEDAIIQNSTIPEELRQRMTDVPKSVLSVIEDKLVVFELGEEVFPGITSKATPGHTLGHSVFIIRYSCYCSFLFPTDTLPLPYIFPSCCHLKCAWNASPP